MIFFLLFFRERETKLAFLWIMFWNLFDNASSIVFAFLCVRENCGYVAHHVPFNTENTTTTKVEGNEYNFVLVGVKLILRRQEPKKINEASEILWKSDKNLFIFFSFISMLDDAVYLNTFGFNMSITNALVLYSNFNFAQFWDDRVSHVIWFHNVDYYKRTEWKTRIRKNKVILITNSVLNTKIIFILFLFVVPVLLI